MMGRFAGVIFDDFQTRTIALECLNRLIDSLDKMMILEEVLPFLTEIQCTDVDIIMAVVCTLFIDLHDNCIQFTRAPPTGVYLYYSNGAN